MVRYVNDNPSGLSYIAVQTSPVRADPEDGPEQESEKERFYCILSDILEAATLGLVVAAAGVVTGTVWILAVLG